MGTNVVLGLAYSFVMPFLSIFGTKEVGMSPLQFGVFMTINSVFGIGFSTFLASKSDTVLSRKTVLILGGISGGLGHLGYAFVRDYFGLLLIGSTLLAASAVTFSQVFAYARDLLTQRKVAPSEAPLYMNVFRLFFALSWTVGPACAAFTMARYSFVGTFVIAAGLFFLFTLGVMLFLPDIEPNRELRAEPALSVWKMFEIPQLPAHFLGFVVYFVCQTMAMMSLPLLILDTLHGTETQVGIAYSVAPLFELPFMFYIGVLATRVDHAVLIRGALVLAAIYYGALSLVTSPALVYPLQIFSAMIVAIMGGLAITFFQNFVPGRAGSTTNLYSSAHRLGSMAGYLLFGSLMGSVGHRFIFAVCAFGSVLSFVLLHATRRRFAPEAT